MKSVKGFALIELSDPPIALDAIVAARHQSDSVRGVCIVNTCHRLSAAVLTWTLVGLLAPVPLANLAYAASTVLSDVPLAAAKRPNPNMIMAIDDSGSMDSEVAFNGNDGALWWRYDKGRFFGFDQTDADRYASTTKSVGLHHRADGQLQRRGRSGQRR